MKRRVAFATAAFAFAPAASALAHAELEGSSPANHAALEHAPARVTLTFDEAVQPPPDAIQVLTPDDANVVRRVSTATARSVTATLQPGLVPAKYTVKWRVVSDDGHVRAGSYRFKVKGGPSGAGASKAAAPDDGDSGGTAVIVAVLAAIAVGAFGLAFARRRRSSRAV